MTLGEWGKAHPEVHAGVMETVRGAELLSRRAAQNPAYW